MIKIKFTDAKYYRILSKILSKENFRYISEIENICISTVYNIRNRFLETGSPLPKRTRLSKYDLIMRELEEFIKKELISRNSTYNRRYGKKVTYKRIFKNLKKKGFDISLSKSNEICMRVNKELDAKYSYLNIKHIPGETCQFDWGSCYIKINNKDYFINLAVFTFPYSNYRKAYIMDNINGESFVKAFKMFIRDIGGIPPNMVFDNMSIAITPKRNGRDAILTKLFADLSTHYSFKALFCHPYSPNQKGSVENGVKIAKELCQIENHKNLKSAEKYLNKKIINLNLKKHHKKNNNINDLFKEEKSKLLHLPEKDFVYYKEEKRVINSNSLVYFQNNIYSVPEAYKKEKALIQFTKNRLYIYSKDKDLLTKYAIQKKSKKKKHRIWYILNKVKHKHRGFIHSEEYSSMSKYEKFIHDKVFKKNSKNFIDFLFTIKDKSRRLAKKLYHKYKDRDFIKLEKFINDPLLL